MIDWVQFAVKIRENGVKDKDLIRHYFKVPKYLAKKINDNIDCLSGEGKVVKFSLYDSDSTDIRFIKGYLSSIEITANTVENARDNINRLFSYEWNIPNNFESFLS